jgi:hypothetical protein
VSEHGSAAMPKPLTGRALLSGTCRDVRWLSRLRKAVPQALTIAGAALALNAAVVPFSAAQNAGLPPPEFSLRDENNVDLLGFFVYLQQADLSIGSNDHPLAHAIFSYADGDWLSNDSGGALRFLDKDSFWGLVNWPGNSSPSNTTCMQPMYVGVTIGSSTETFVCLPGNTIVAAGSTGSTLSYDAGNTFTYTKSDGEIIVYGQVPPANPPTPNRYPTQIRYPDGRVLTWWYYDDGTGAPLLKSITRNDGLQLKYTYTHLASGVWSLASVTAINNAYEYCSPTASTCSLTMAWPTVNYSFTQSNSGSVFTVTDAAGLATRYTEDALTANTPTSWGRTVGIKLPSSASADNITYTYCDNRSTWCTNFGSVGWPDLYYKNYVVAVTRDGQTWNYAGTPGSPSGTQCGNATYGFTNPVGSGKQVNLYGCVPNPAFAHRTPGYGSLIQLTDEHGVRFNADPDGVLVKNTIMPEGNQTNYTWDGNNGGQISAPVGRGNLIQETLVPKSGSSLAQVNLYANYDTTCAIPVKCNKPNLVKDALGHETDYTYDPTHGGVLTVTLPADANGIRPQTRYAYGQRYAWYKNASGSIVQAAIPIWVMATERFCRTSAALANGTGCAGTTGQYNDEVTTTYEYGPTTGPNNLFLHGKAVAADGVTLRKCYSYDVYGNKISETTPNAGLASCP